MRPTSLTYLEVKRKVINDKNLDMIDFKGPHLGKTCLQGFRQHKIQTSLFHNNEKLGYRNFARERWSHSILQKSD